jgi:23S rRNA (adenine2503-C2)-methyltransferase
MTLALLRDWTDAGAGPRHARLLLRQWLAGSQPSPDALPRSVPPPARFLAEWPRLAASLEETARIASRHPSADGSERLLVRLHDGRT